MASSYVKPNFLTPNRLAEMIVEFAMEEVHGGTRYTPGIKVEYCRTHHNFQKVLEISV